MKKFGIVIFVVALLVGVVFANLFSFGKVSGKIFNFSFGNSIHGSGVAASEVRNVGDFNGVDVGGVFDVEIVAGRDFEVKVEADDNLIPHIKTEVSDGILKISSSSHRLKSQTPLKIRVSAPNIESLDASGAVKISLSGVKNKDLRVDTSGASKIRLEGETVSLSVEVSGASKVDAESLRAVNATVDASGASHADVFVTGKFVSEASGASKIGYAGNPASIEKSSSGASKVYQK
jgi:hypothetical protein